MRIQTYRSAAAFLARAQAVLEASEAANSLMLGIAFQLKRLGETGEPPSYRITGPPYLATVEDEAGVAMAAVMTPPFQLVVSAIGPELSEGPRLIVQDLLESDRRIPGVGGHSDAARACAEAWTAQTGQTHELEMRQRIYELRRVAYRPPTPGGMRLATEADVELLAEWMLGFYRDAGATGDRERARSTVEIKVKDRDFYIWDDGGPVSTAAKARPMNHGISISAVYTPLALRRRGYATACVAALSQLLLDSGWQFCALFTDLANPTSNSIYQRIGYRPVCDFNQYKFAQVP